MLTIEELKKKKEFKVKEFDPFSPKKVELSTYTFVYEKKEEKLYITGDVFGKEMHRVINSLEVLFNIAKRREISVNIDKKMTLKITSFEVVL